MKKAVATLGAILMAVALVASVETQSAEARPNYKAEWDKKYMADGSAMKKAIEKSNCNVCHLGKDRKKRNEYGAAIGKALGEPKVKDATKLTEAFAKVEKEKSPTDGKTFGDLINEGKLPLTVDEK